MDCSTSTSETSENAFLFAFSRSLECVFSHSISLEMNYNFLRMQWEIKLYQENVSHERTLSLDQWQICRKLYTDESFSYKITENNCRSRHFAVVIQIPKRYPTSFDKISFLTLILLIISSQIFSWKLNSSRTFFLPNFSYLSLRL